MLGCIVFVHLKAMFMTKEIGKIPDFWAVEWKYYPFLIFCCSYVSFVLYFSF